MSPDHLQRHSRATVSNETLSVMEGIVATEGDRLDLHKEGGEGLVMPLHEPLRHQAGIPAPELKAVVCLGGGSRDPERLLAPRSVIRVILYETR